MLKFEDDCVGCPQGCIMCGRRHTPYFYCDRCGECYEPEDLYDVGGEMVCAACLCGEYSTVADHPEKWDPQARDDV